MEDAFNEWPTIDSQVEGCGGWKELSKQSRNNYNKRRHLVQRISMLMEHGLSATSACRVYAHIQQQGGFSLAELRDAVNFAEPVPDSRAKGGKPASRKDTDIMPLFLVTLVTKGQILLWHAKALQAELSQARDKAALVKPYQTRPDLVSLGLTSILACLRNSLQGQLSVIVDNVFSTSLRTHHQHYSNQNWELC